jgi:hypothetical protein
MTEVLKQVDLWFLIMAVVLLGGFFLWAVKYLFDGIKASIEKLAATFDRSMDKLERLINELFRGRNDHEARLTAVETRCAVLRCPDLREEHMTERTSGGRRPYDPHMPIETSREPPPHDQ